MDTTIFNKNFAILRRRKNISLRKMAQEIKIDARTLNGIEYHNSEVKASILIPICDYFQVNDIREVLTKRID